MNPSVRDPSFERCLEGARANKRDVHQSRTLGQIWSPGGESSVLLGDLIRLRIRSNLTRGAERAERLVDQSERVTLPVSRVRANPQTTVLWSLEKECLCWLASSPCFRMICAHSPTPKTLHGWCCDPFGEVAICPIHVYKRTPTSKAVKPLAGGFSWFRWPCSASRFGRGVL